MTGTIYSGLGVSTLDKRISENGAKHRSHIVAVCFLVFAGLVIVHPFVAILFAIVLVVTSIDDSIEKLPFIFLLAVSLALVISTRTIPAVPADDLMTYWAYYHIARELDPIEIIQEFRYEPILYWIYAYILPPYTDARSLLFANSFIVSFTYLLASKSIRKHYNLPMWSYAVLLTGFPYEIVSNIPRQMFATFISLWLLFSPGWNRFLFVPVALATHKSTLMLFLFRLIPFWKPYYAIYLCVSVLVGVFGMALLDLFINLGFGSRVVSFFARDPVSKVFVFFCFFIICGSFVFFSYCRREYIVFVYVTCIALMVSDLGPLGVRMSYYIYLPTLFGLVFFAKSFFFPAREFAISLIMLVVFSARMIFLSSSGTHDPFAEYSVGESFFFIYRIF